MKPSPLKSPPIESRLVRTLLDGDFALTAEVVPPLAGSAAALLDRVAPLRDRVDAINLTDGASARVHMSPLAAAAILLADGVEPVLQFTCRDRNRIALMGDLLGAAALGVHNLLILRGDDPTLGDQPHARPVFDMESHDLIRCAAEMTNLGIIPSSGMRVRDSGIEPTSRPIDTPPHFFIGAADTPTPEADERHLLALHRKVDSGAQFLQTQLCYDIEVVRRYAARLRDERLSERLFVLIGSGPLASARSALWMRDNLWGVNIPDAIVARLDKAADSRAEGVRIAIEQLEQLAEIPGIAGAHLMAPANTRSIPAVLDGFRAGR